MPSSKRMDSSEAIKETAVNNQTLTVKQAALMMKADTCPPLTFQGRPIYHVFGPWQYLKTDSPYYSLTTMDGEHIEVAGRARLTVNCDGGG